MGFIDRIRRLKSRIARREFSRADEKKRCDSAADGSIQYGDFSFKPRAIILTVQKV